jgi:DNA polymerase II large subunit
MGQLISIKLNMESYNFFNIEEIAKYLAMGSQKIVDEMKKQNKSDTDFDDKIQELEKISKLKQEKAEDEFHEKHLRLREKFRKRR